MPLRYWLFVALTLALTAVVSIVTYRSGRLLQQWRPDRNLLLLLSENIVRLFLIAASLALGWLSGLPLEVLGWSTAGWSAALVQGLVWGAIMAAGLFATTTWIVAHSGDKHYSPVVVDAILPRSAQELAWTAIAMIGVVAAEELLFRSLLVGGFQPIVPAALLVALTSLIFGVLHMPQGSWGVVGAAAAGALLGLLFLLSGSIFAPIAAHYVTNMIQVVQAMRQRRRKEAAQITAPLDG